MWASFQAPRRAQISQQLQHRQPLRLRPELVVLEHRLLERAQVAEIGLREQALVELDERRRAPRPTAPRSGMRGANSFCDSTTRRHSSCVNVSSGSTPLVEGLQQPIRLVARGRVVAVDGRERCSHRGQAFGFAGFIE